MFLINDNLKCINDKRRPAFKLYSKTSIHIHVVNVTLALTDALLAGVAEMCICEMQAGLQIRLSLVVMISCERCINLNVKKLYKIDIGRAVN